MPYGSTDLGGFAGETNPELLTRFFQAGTFFPNMRAHSTVDATPHFPWLFGPDAEKAITHAIRLRYQLVPYLYSLAHNCHERGDLLMRPLVCEYPNDPAVATINDQWLVGEGVMAAPILTHGGERDVYLPGGTWFEFFTGKAFPGGLKLHVKCTLDDVPVFVRAGTILPLATVADRTADLVKAPLEIRIYPGQNAAFTLVEDDGATNAYLKGSVRKTTFQWNDATKELTWQREGTFDGPTYKAMKVAVVGETPWTSPETPLVESGRVKTGQ
ncbi:MAG: glycoside hydrolase family 31 protein [Tepidisphaeraceae bacterium]